jgi:CSLREA domain-containing protein
MRFPFFHRSHSSSLRSKRRRAANRFRPCLEWLEARQVLSTIVVTTFADVVANDGQTSLREAIAEAAGLAGDDTIELPAGNYPLALGQLTINDASGSVTIESDGGPATIDAGFTSRVLQVTSVSDVTLDGLTITGGFADNGAGILNAGTLAIEASTLIFNFAFATHGGAIYNNLGTLSVSDTDFNTNFSLLGGAISSNHALTVEGGSFVNNTASSGGGIFNTGSASIEDTDFDHNTGSGIHNALAGVLHVAYSLFTFNSASRGGGIHNNNGDVTVEGSEFQSNQASQFGGGIYSDATLHVEDTDLVGNMVGGSFGNPGRGGGIFVAGTATIEGSTLSGNQVQFGEGGGIFVSQFSTASIETSTLSGNMVLFGDGGGIFNGGTLTIENTSLSGNQAGIQGGGMVNFGSATLSNATVEGNFANGNGGGILNFNSLTVGDSDVNFNFAGFEGGGIANLGTATITDSALSGNVASSGAGGAIDNRFTGTVTGSTFSGNSAPRGGGVANESGATISIASSNFAGNSASAGGGISNQGTATVADSTLENNTATSNGGAIANESGFGSPTSITITDTVLSGNSASSGGGIYNFSATATIEGSTLDDNSAVFGSGGGIFNASFGGPTAIVSLTASTVSGNSADFVGGGIVNFGAATMNIAASTLNDNTAAFLGGGGIFNQSFGGLAASVTITASTLSGNTAVGDGGAIYNDDDFGGAATIDITSGTISGNSATANGGGIFNTGTATFRNTIVAGNTAPTGPDVSGAFTSLGYNLIGIGDGSTGFGATGDQVGTATSPIDPMLGALADNGGPTFTMALLPGSPALNAGDPGLTGTTDQRGVLRPQGPGVDIGAFELEYQTIDVVVKPGSDDGPINLNSNGLTPVAILGSADFDAASVDLSDLSLLKAEDPTLGIQISPVQATLEDTNGDGLLDLLLFFSTEELADSGALDAESTALLLTGFTTDGLGLFGTASVRTVGGSRRA